MNRSLLTRGFVIVAVVLAFLIAAYPPSEKISLGLDLQGGMHLVLQVQTDDAIRAEVDKDADRLEQELAEEGITGAAIERTGETSFAVTGIQADRDTVLRDDIVATYLPGWEFEREGDRVLFEMTAQNESELRELAVRQALETIRNRVDEFGVAEPVIHREGIGGDRIVVQLPGVDDPERVKDLIKNTAFLEFRLVADGGAPADTREAVVSQFGGRLPAEVEVMEERLLDNDGNQVGSRYWPLEAKRVITGRDLKTARVTAGDFNEPEVFFILTREGGRKFGETTGANVGRNLAIVLDDKVMSAPTINSRISDQGVIQGQFNAEEAQDLALVLRSGALPAGIVYLEERTVGPSLGEDSIEKGQRAGIIGLVLVALTMLVVYKLSGFNAVSALLLNIVILFGALAMAGANLTLPGIAGIVLTIGMAVDANVLIFERIREELRSGRTVKSAIAAGFSKALSSILDANVTTLIAAIFLFLFGTGPIRGFAVTLSVGILASIFTAVFVSRWLFDLVHGRRQRVDSLSI